MDYKTLNIMKNILIIIALALVIGCENNPEITPDNDMNYLVYNDAMKCRPIETESGFFVVTERDSLPALINISTSGKRTSIISLSDYLSDDLTIDSISNLGLHLNMAGNIVIAFSYTDNTSSAIITQALEVSQSGSIVDDVSYSIPLQATEEISFISYSKTEENDWLLIMGSMETSDTPGSLPNLTIQTKQINSNNEVKEFSYDYEGFSINSNYPLANNSVALFLSPLQKNSGPNMESENEVSQMLIIDSYNSMQEILFSTSYAEIGAVVYENNELAILGTLNTDAEGSSIMCQIYDDTYNLNLTYQPVLGEGFIPTSIKLLNDQFVIGGFTGEFRDIAWNNIYSSSTSTLEMYAFDYDGAMLWDKLTESQFSGMIVGITNNETDLAFLLSKSTYNTYQNMALLKTDLNGNLK